MENDYHEKISWIKSKPVSLSSKDFTVNVLETTYIQIYFGLKEKDGKPYLTEMRLVNNYDDTDWVFFDEVSYLFGSRKEIRNHKGVTFKLEDNETVRNTNRGVTERSDIVALGQGYDFIKYVINSKETRLSVRFLNSRDSKYREFVLSNTKKLKKHFKALIDSYNKLNETYGLNKPF